MAKEKSKDKTIKKKSNILSQKHLGSNNVFGDKINQYHRDLL